MKNGKPFVLAGRVFLAGRKRILEFLRCLKCFGLMRLMRPDGVKKELFNDPANLVISFWGHFRQSTALVLILIGFRVANTEKNRQSKRRFIDPGRYAAPFRMEIYANMLHIFDRKHKLFTFNIYFR